MKIGRKEFQDWLKIAGKLVSKNRLPILHNLYFHENKVMATDFESVMVLETDNEPEGNDFLASLADVKKIADTVKTAEIEIACTGPFIAPETRIIINGKYKLYPAGDPEEYPKMDRIPPVTMFSLSLKNWKALLKIPIRDDQRPHIFSLWFDFANGNICSCNGGQLYASRILSADYGKPALVHANFADLIAGLEKRADLCYAIDKEWFIFRSGNWLFFHRMPGGEFPPYLETLNSGKNSMLVGKEEFGQVLKEAQIVDGNVVFEIENGSVTISASSPEKGECREPLPIWEINIMNQESETIHVFMNSSQILQALDCLGGDLISVKFMDGNHPMIFAGLSSGREKRPKKKLGGFFGAESGPAESGDLSCLIMPMRH